MVAVTDFRIPRSLDFAHHRKAKVFRDRGVSWSKVARNVVNLGGLHPGVRTLVKHFAALKSTGRCKSYHTDKCGRRPWKVTPQIENFIVRRLLALRRCCTCTATTLQREVAKEMDVQLDTSSVRKILIKKDMNGCREHRSRRYRTG